MTELQPQKQEKIQELTDRIGETIIDLAAEYEDDLMDRHIFAAITFAAFCTISSLMEYLKPGHPEEWYEEFSYNCITQLLANYRSPIVDAPQETESNK